MNWKQVVFFVVAWCAISSTHDPVFGSVGHGIGICVGSLALDGLMRVSERKGRLEEKKSSEASHGR